MLFQLTQQVAEEKELETEKLNLSGGRLAQLFPKT